MRYPIIFRFGKKALVDKPSDHFEEDQRPGFVREGEGNRVDPLQNQPPISLQRFLPPRRIGRSLEEKDSSFTPDQSDPVLEDDGGRNRPRQQKIVPLLPHRPAQMLQTILKDGNPFQPEQADEMVEEGGLLSGRFQEGHLQLGARNLQDQARKTGAGPHIDPALPLHRLQQGQRGERIQKVFDEDLPIASKAGEIDRTVPADQLREVK